MATFNQGFGTNQLGAGERLPARGSSPGRSQWQPTR